MASISSVISLFVLLLATYCYSAPTGETFEYSTIHSVFPVEHDSMPMTSFEATTAFPHSHNKRTKDVHTGTDSESDEYTTEQSSLYGLKQHEQTFDDLTTSSMVERSYNERKYVPTKGSKSSSYKHQYPSKHSSFNQGKYNKRTIGDETTLSMVERSDDIHTFDDTTEESKFTTSAYQKREEADTFDFTTIEMPSEESNNNHNIDTDLFNTVESSTEFNVRGSRFMQGEPTMTTFTEPTSSFETLAGTTGLLHSRTVPETFGHKAEGSSEEDFTTVMPDN